MPVDRRGQGRTALETAGVPAALVAVHRAALEGIPCQARASLPPMTLGCKKKKNVRATITVPCFSQRLS